MKKSNPCRIGMAGLDTSHVSAFAALLHDANDEFHVPGGRIVAAFPGGSPDFPQSIDRVEKYTVDLRDTHGVEIVSSLSELKGKCDAIMLESIDGRVHLEQFVEVAEWGLPVFIDKPLTISSEEAREVARVADKTKTRVTSASALRFAETFQEALGENGSDKLAGAECYGPMIFLEKCPGYFWYGIHTAEMLFASLGTGCRTVLAVREQSHDLIVGRWADGRIGTARGNRTGNFGFGGTLHRPTSSISFDITKGTTPFYASLLKEVMHFFRGQSEIVSIKETVEVIRFLEAANESTETGGWVDL